MVKWATKKSLTMSKVGLHSVPTCENIEEEKWLRLFCVISEIYKRKMKCSAAPSDRNFATQQNAAGHHQCEENVQTTIERRIVP